jgi:uncharacterized alkaline shock family protein YloU
MSKAVCHLHRAVITLLLLVIAAGGAGSAYVLVYSHSRGGDYAGPSSLTTRLLTQSTGWLQTQIGSHGGVISSVSIGIVVLTLFFVWLELRTVVRPLPRLVLSRGSLGQVAINLDQISRLAQREAERVSGVREVETVAQTHKGGIDVKQTVSVEPEMAYMPLAEQVQQRVKKSLEHHLGFPVASVEVLLQHASLRKSVI